MAGQCSLYYKSLGKVYFPLNDRYRLRLDPEDYLVDIKAADGTDICLVGILGRDSS